MPEGPEVRRITDHLTKVAAGGTLDRIDFIDARYTPGGSQMRNKIGPLVVAMPVKIEKVDCHGKFIYWQLNDFVIFQTLGMSGTWRQRKPSKHHRLTFHITKADGKKVALHYKDTRCFGTFIINEGRETLEKKLGKDLGPDLLQVQTPREEVQTIFRKKNKQNITKVLMNQKVFAGIGNYLKAEILHECKLSPKCKIEDLSDDELWNLYNVARWHICASYSAKGASFKDYVMPDGSKGGTQYNFKVYQRKVCSCGQRVTRAVTPDKRPTWWCSDCQTIPTQHTSVGSVK